jgi:hypothetical protein
VQEEIPIPFDIAYLRPVEVTRQPVWFEDHGAAGA